MPSIMKKKCYKNSSKYLKYDFHWVRLLKCIVCFCYQFQILLLKVITPNVFLKSGHKLLPLLEKILQICLCDVLALHTFFY